MILCVLLGCIPFALGGFMNWYMMEHMDVLPPYLLISAGMLVIWTVIAFGMKYWLKNSRKVIIGLNAVPFLVMILFGIQDLILGAYWMNFLGQWTQYFYLPLMNLGFKLTAWSSRMTSAVAVSFLLLVAASALGCKLEEK